MLTTTPYTSTNHQSMYETCLCQVFESSYDDIKMCSIYESYDGRPSTCTTYRSNKTYKDGDN